MTDPRGHRRYREYRSRVRVVHEAQARACDICGNGIDYALRHPSVWAWTLEHTTPLATGGELMPTNPGAAHQDCQNRQGGQLRHHIRSLGTPSRPWA